MLDPGLDFAKQRDDNLAVLARAGGLARFGRPVLLPVSRKTVIGEVLGQPDPRDRDPGTLACLVAGALRLPGCLFRVHNVRAAAQSVRVLQAVAQAAGPLTPRASPAPAGASERAMPGFPIDEF